MRKLKRPIYFYRFDLIEMINQTLEKKICLESIVCGNSMEPTAFAGDKILIKPVKSKKDLKVGMVVAFLSSDFRHFIIHRIKHIDNKNEKVYEQGDNRTSGSYIDIHKIKGIVIKINNKDV